MNGIQLTPVAVIGLIATCSSVSRVFAQGVYAGSGACKTCHPDIYRKQEASNHARSLRAPQDVAELTAALPVNLDDRASGAVVSLERDASGEIAVRARKGVGKASMPLAFAFGSGVKAITPLARARDGSFIESRLSWYASLKAIEFTTGASRYDPVTARENLGKTLSEKEVAECFGCHTTGYDPQRRAPARNEMGVRCERCHGPGSAHIASANRGQFAAREIFHPGRLSGFEQLQMCGECHGKPPRDSDFAELRMIETTPRFVRFPSQRLVLSRCFNESGQSLKCTRCHDPHQDVSPDPAENDKACVSCHNQKAGASVCRTGTEKCAGCHMPRERVMRHTLIADHWIRIPGARRE